jgi:GT2 family glycosyltransferase
MMGKRDGIRLDETYHSYYEDVEWSLRASISSKTGYFDPLATGIHQGSATAGAGSDYSTRQILRNHRRLAYQYLLPEYGSQYRIARTLLRTLFLRHGQWPHSQEDPIPPKLKSSQLGTILQESEKLLYELQMAETPDRLWRWYFRLTGGNG